MKMAETKKESIRYTVCKDCRGVGGRYVFVKNKKKKKSEVVFEDCSICNGDGKIEDHRSRDEILDDWQNETNRWIDCKSCDGDGYLCDEKGNEYVCSVCEGYGVVKDERTPEVREAERIVRNQRKFEEKISQQILDDELDFYGDNKEKKFKEELANLQRKGVQLQERNGKKSSRILREVKEIFQTVEFIALIALILIVFRCSDKTEDNLRNDNLKLRDEIESMDRSIDNLEKKIDMINEKIDGFGYRKSR